MSGFNILVQPNQGAVHVLTDGLGYDVDGIVQQISPKCYAIPHAHCVVGSLGAGRASLAFAIELGERFRNFDDLIDAAENECRDIFDHHMATTFANLPYKDVQLFIAGWSQKRAQPEAYLMFMSDGESDVFWMAQHASDGAMPFEPFKLRPVTSLTVNPIPSDEMIATSGFQWRGSTEEQITENLTTDDLLHVMEMQRRMKTPLRTGFDPHHWIGGFALLMSVTREGIAQKVLHHWTEDKVGELVTPRPIDWKAWRAARTVAASNVDFTGLSRLQRERLMKKAKKGTLR